MIDMSAANAEMAKKQTGKTPMRITLEVELRSLCDAQGRAAIAEEGSA